MPHSTKSLARMQNGIDTQQPFDCENMRGVDPISRMDTGRLAEPWRTEFVNACAERRISYVIYSYGSPIAWFYTYPPVGRDYGWFVPEWKSSVMTTNHQRAVRIAIENPGYYVELHLHVVGTGVR